MQDLAVLKFGGTSVKNIGRIQHVADIVATTPARKRLVVVSAMGDATDYLHSLAKQCSGLPDKRELDMLLATGEQVSIALLALTLRQKGINARSFTGQQIGICTDEIHSDARIMDFDRARLDRCMSQCDVAVIAGFQGYSAGGDITTLGRGGSDTSAVAVAAASGARECTIYTDVDGVFSADPNKIAQASMVEHLSYDDTIALARAGAQVIHPRAVELAREYKIRLKIRNTFKPASRGSIISGEEEMEKIHHSYAVAIDTNQAICSLTGISRQIPILDTINEKLAQQDVTIDVLSQPALRSTAKRDLHFAIRFADLDRARSGLRQLEKTLEGAELSLDVDIAKVSLVGIGCAVTPSVAGCALRALERAGVTVKMATSGDTKISFFVPKSQSEFAVQVVHDHLPISQTNVA